MGGDSEATVSRTWRRRTRGMGEPDRGGRVNARRAGKIFIPPYVVLTEDGRGGSGRTIGKEEDGAPPRGPLVGSTGVASHRSAGDASRASRSNRAGGADGPGEARGDAGGAHRCWRLLVKMRSDTASGTKRVMRGGPADGSRWATRRARGPSEARRRASTLPGSVAAWVTLSARSPSASRSRGMPRARAEDAKSSTAFFFVTPPPCADGSASDSADSPNPVSRKRSDWSTPLTRAQSRRVLGTGNARRVIGKMQTARNRRLNGETRRLIGDFAFRGENRP